MDQLVNGSSFISLVQRNFIVAVVNLFLVAFIVTASARGQ
jgi:hypothetical protein